MSTALAITGDQKYWSQEQLSALKQLGLSNASNGDLAVFFHQAQKTGLDPFARQIYMIERGGRFGIQSSIDGLRIVAQRSGEYAGQSGPFWCGEDGKWVDVWLAKTPPLAAKVGVYRQGFPEALYAVARWDSYAVPNNPIWRKMPDLMLAKCAEALALRKAFPNDLSGIYTDDEMSQVDTVVIEETPKPQKVSLKAVVNTTANTLSNEEMLKIIEDMKAINTKEALRDYWKQHEQVLDVSIPNSKTTLREILLDRVKEFNV
jgi:phage recombination protein Bet